METPSVPQESFEDRAIAELQPSGAPVVPPGGQKGEFTHGQRSSPFFDSRKVGEILQKTAAVTQDANAAAQAPIPAPAQAEAPKETAPPAQQAQPDKPADQKASDTLPKVEDKLAPMPDVDLSRLPGFKDEVKADDVDSIKRIVEKYKDDPDRLANALLHERRLRSSHDVELAQLRRTVDDLRMKITEPKEYGEYDEQEEEPERPPVRQRNPRGQFERKAEPQEVNVKAEIAAIKERVRNEDIDQLEAQELIAEVMQKYMDSREQSLKAELRAEQNKQEQERELATQEQVNVHNARVYHDRARAILADQAKRQGQAALVEKYSNTEYELSEDEYRVAQPRLMQEFQHVSKNYRIPDSGKVSTALFERAARELDPQSFEQQIRLDERRKTLQMMKQGQPVGTRVDTGSGISQSRAPVGGPTPPATAKDYTSYQNWYLSLPPEERARVRKERGLN